MTSNLLMLFKSSTVWRCLKSVPRPDGIAAGTALAPTSQAGLSHRALHQHAPTIPGRKQSTEAKRSKAKQSPYCLSQYVTKLVTMAYNGDAIRSTRQIKTMQSFNQFHSKCNQLEINLKSTKRHIFVADFDWFCNLQDSVPSNRVRNGISFWPCFTVVDLWGSNRRFLPNIPVLQTIPKVLDTLLMENVRCNLYCLHCEKFLFLFFFTVAFLCARCGHCFALVGWGRCPPGEFWTGAGLGHKMHCIWKTFVIKTLIRLLITFIDYI